MFRPSFARHSYHTNQESSWVPKVLVLGASYRSTLQRPNLWLFLARIGFEGCEVVITLSLLVVPWCFQLLRGNGRRVSRCRFNVDV